jgi:hypothetical protein
MRWIRFQPPGVGQRPSGIGRSAELVAEGHVGERRRHSRDELAS